MLSIDWENHHGAVWRPYSKRWHAVQRISAPSLDQLLNIEPQKRALRQNTERFLKKLPAQHAKLWGAKGTGKSSLVRAIAKAYTRSGLRIVQLCKADLIMLPDVVDALRNEPYRFIVFFDDLSFSDVNDDFQMLKSMIDGTIEAPAENIRYYVTSNHRRFINESMQHNLQSDVARDTLNHSEVVEDKLALADRFGLELSFYTISQSEYFLLIEKGLNLSLESDHEKRRLAIQFATQKGTRNARTAEQFCAQFINQ